MLGTVISLCGKRSCKNPSSWVLLGDIVDVVPVPRNGKRKKSNASSTVVTKGDAIWRKNLSRDCKFNIRL